MANRLSLTFTGEQGFDFTAFTQLIEFGAYTITGDTGTVLSLATDATTLALLGIPATSLNITLNYETIEGVFHYTGFSVTLDAVPALQAQWSEGFSSGFTAWPGSGAFTNLWLTAYTVTGSGGPDIVTGTELADRMAMGGGDDMAGGAGGRDRIDGGAGNDLLLGGEDNDTLFGKGGRDLLITGPGTDLAKGGDGNDILIFDSGKATAWGGRGNDVFVEEVSVRNQVRIKDFDPKRDVLVFSGHVEPAKGDIGRAQTLAQLKDGMIDDFEWTQTKRGVVIEAGSAKMVLDGVKARQIDLDMILFTQASARATALLSDGDGTTGPYGVTAAGDTITADPGVSGYLTITMNEALGPLRLWQGDISGFLDAGGGGPIT